jgi:hypothetical protein
VPKYVDSTKQRGLSSANTTVLAEVLDCPLHKWEAWEPFNHAKNSSPGFFTRRSKVVERLIHEVADEEAGDENWFNKYNWDGAHPVVSLFATIKNVLVGGSPMKGFRRCCFDKALARQSIVRDVACMMEFGQRLGFEEHDYSFPSATAEILQTDITTWAQEWEVLDLWVEALQTCGILVPRHTRKAWIQDKHLYSRSNLSTCLNEREGLEQAGLCLEASEDDDIEETSDGMEEESEFGSYRNSEFEVIADDM